MTSTWRLGASSGIRRPIEKAPIFEEQIPSAQHGALRQQGTHKGISCTWIADSATASAARRCQVASATWPICSRATGPVLVFDHPLHSYVPVSKGNLDMRTYRECEFVFPDPGGRTATARRSPAGCTSSLIGRDLLGSRLGFSCIHGLLDGPARSALTHFDRHAGLRRGQRRRRRTSTCCSIWTKSLRTTSPLKSLSSEVAAQRQAMRRSITSTLYPRPPTPAPSAAHSPLSAWVEPGKRAPDGPADHRHNNLGVLRGSGNASAHVFTARFPIANRRNASSTLHWAAPCGRSRPTRCLVHASPSRAHNLMLSMTPPP